MESVPAGVEIWTNNGILGIDQPKTEQEKLNHVDLEITKTIHFPIQTVISVIITVQQILYVSAQNTE